MSEILAAAGSTSPFILGLAGLGVLVMLGLAGVGLTQRRVPLAAFVVVPLLVCAVGAIGAWATAGTALTSLGNTAADQIVSVAAEGTKQALGVDWSSRWVAAFLFGLGSWAAGVGALFAGPWARLTPMSAVGSVVLTLAGAGVIGAFAQNNPNYGLESATPIIALLLFSGFGVAFSSIRRAMYEEAHRVAAMRFTSAMCMLLAVSYGSRAVTMGARMDAFGPEGHLSAADSLASAIGLWGEFADPALAVSWLAFGFAILVAFASIYYELGEVVERITLFDVAITLVLLGSLGLVRLVEDSRIDSLAAIETSAPASELFADVGNDLPSALIELEDSFVTVRPTNGGFGDVIAWNDKDKVWNRVKRWNGSSWDDDNTPLDSVNNISQLRSLFVVPGGADAAPLAQAMEKAGGKGLLLLRAEEVKADVQVPAELAHWQFTFLPLELDDKRDLAVELWNEAGAREVNWGPSPWFGQEMDEVPVVYATAALADTESPGLQIIVDETSRVKGIINSCMPALVDKLENEEAVEPNDAWCHISNGEKHEVVAEAMEAREAVAPTRFRASLGRPGGLAAAGIGAKMIMDRVPHEYAAIDYCFGQAVDEGEELNGSLQMTMKFSRKGKTSVSLNEKSPNNNGMAFRCVRERISEITFDVNDEAWPEAAEGEPHPPQEIPFTLEIQA